MSAFAPSIRAKSEHQDSMWAVPTEIMKRSWAPCKQQIELGRSNVAGTVAVSLIEDCASLICPDTVYLPTAQGDDSRAEQCFFWLAKWATPIWLSWGIKKLTPHKAGVIGPLAQDLEYADHSLAQVGPILQKLYLALSSDELHRRSLHYAQRLGMRAVYRGAALHQNPQVHMLSLMAARIAAGAVPSAEAKDESIMIAESTRASVLLLFDELIMERG